MKVPLPWATGRGSSISPASLGRDALQVETWNQAADVKAGLGLTSAQRFNIRGRQAALQVAILAARAAEVKTLAPFLRAKLQGKPLAALRTFIFLLWHGS